MAITPARPVDFTIRGDRHIALTVTFDTGRVDHWFDLTFDDLKALLADYGFRQPATPRAACQ